MGATGKCDHLCKYVRVVGWPLIVVVCIHNLNSFLYLVMFLSCGFCSFWIGILEDLCPKIYHWYIPSIVWCCLCLWRSWAALSIPSELGSLKISVQSFMLVYLFYHMMLFMSDKRGSSSCIFHLHSQLYIVIWGDCIHEMGYVSFHSVIICYDTVFY